MIFVTVGHQMPFDRLIDAVDAWAQQRGRNDIFAQIGETEHRPKHIKYEKYLSPAEFDRNISSAGGIVAHAGTGTIIAALKLGKPLLVLPRHASREETRNDHQIATTKYFEQSGYVLAAYSEDDLAARLDELESFQPRSVIGDAASEPLLRQLREFVFGDERNPR